MIEIVYMQRVFKTKYTKDLLEPLIKKNVSVAGVMRDLGLKALQGGSHSHLTKVIKNLGLDIGHFTGKLTNRGENHRGGPQKKLAKDILVLRNQGQRQKAFRLRRALIEIGRLYKCLRCGVEGTWLNKPLVLEVDHKNKNFLDDRAENLEFLCPNCHSQTDGYCRAKGCSEVTSATKYWREKRRQKRGDGGKADALRLGRNG